MLLLKSPPRHAVDFLLLTVFIIQQSGYKMAVGARQTFCNCLIKQDNGNAPRERQWPTGTNGARSSMTAQLLSKSFILLYSKLKPSHAEKPPDSIWPLRRQKYSPGQPFPSRFTAESAAHHPCEQRLFSGSHMDSGPPIDTDSVTVILTTFFPWKSRHQCFLLQPQELHSLQHSSDSTCNITSKWTLKKQSPHLHLCKWLLIEMSLSCV